MLGRVLRGINAIPLIGGLNRILGFAFGFVSGLSLIHILQREIRRGSRYDAGIMDPPSYGRGPNGEIWKLEDNVYDLITLTEQVRCV